MKQVDLSGLFAQAFEKYWDLKIFSDFNGESYTYGEAAQIIHQLHCYFKGSGLQQGDKVALLGRNSSNWGIAFLATLTYGAVVVPVLPDFSTEDTLHILNHSEAKLLFLNDTLSERIDDQRIPQINSVISLVSFKVIIQKKSGEENVFPRCFSVQEAGKADRHQLHYKSWLPEEVCFISYTSGTSGFTKGVVLPSRSILSNIIYAREHMPLKAGDRIVSFLPMAHAFGLLFDFLFPITLGAHITFLTKAPTPQIITKAFSQVKPNLILSVPLVIEKIYRKNIVPMIGKPSVKLLMAIPGVSVLIRRKIRAKLVETFGGEFYEVVIGGAPLNKEVESFFRKIRFPFTIGYGMTECGPLISYDSWASTRPASAGKLVDRMEVKIDSDDPYHIVGEILVRGANTMLGYYKNEEATKASLEPDGWLRTGDLGIIDRNNYIFLRGRSKNMILGPSGQNIYPEELEARLCDQPYIQECVVVDRKGKLLALIYPDKEAVAAQSIDDQQLGEIMKENLNRVNRELPKYEQIGGYELVGQEFEKTPKKSIKRYLYQ